MNYAAGAAHKIALTTWERIWYVLMCIGLGAGYFAKIPTAKALSELPQFSDQSRMPDQASGR